MRGAACLSGEKPTRKWVLRRPGAPKWGKNRRVSSICVVRPQTEITYPSARVVSRTFNANDQLATIYSNALTYASYDYDQNARLSQIDYASGVTESFSYDSHERLNLLEQIGAAVTNTYELGRDNNGNVTWSVATNNGTAAAHHYAYDVLDRVRTRTNDVLGLIDEDIGYDRMGNWQSYSNSAGHESRTIDAANAYTQVGAETVANDANGNITNYVGCSFEYDFLNRLIGVTSNGTTIVGYTYDALNRRTTKSVNGTTTTFYYHDAEVVEEHVDDVLDRQYIYGHTIDCPVVMIDGASQYYYLRDWRANVSTVTDSSGALAERYEYSLFGKADVYDADGNSITNTAIGNPYLFTGRRLDAETGLLHYRNRAYHPHLGRFMQQDPAGFVDGLNLYAYARNNPLSFSDPYGLWTLNVEEEFGWDGEQIAQMALAGARARDAAAAHDRHIDWYVSEHPDEIQALIDGYAYLGMTRAGAVAWHEATGMTELPDLGTTKKHSHTRQEWLIDYIQTGVIHPDLAQNMKDKGYDTPMEWFNWKAGDAQKMQAQKHWMRTSWEGLGEMLSGDPFKMALAVYNPGYAMTWGMTEAIIDGEPLTFESMWNAGFNAVLSEEQQAGFAKVFSVTAAPIIRDLPIPYMKEAEWAARRLGWDIDLMENLGEVYDDSPKWLKPYIGTIVSMPLYCFPGGQYIAPYVSEGIQAAVEDRDYNLNAATLNLAMQEGMGALNNHMPSWLQTRKGDAWFVKGAKNFGQGAIGGAVPTALMGGDWEDIAYAALASGAGSAVGNSVGNKWAKRIINPAVQAGAASILQGEDPWEMMRIQVLLGVYRGGLDDLNHWLRSWVGKAPPRNGPQPVNHPHAGVDAGRVAEMGPPDMSSDDLVDSTARLLEFYDRIVDYAEQTVDFLGNWLGEMQSAVAGYALARYDLLASTAASASFRDLRRDLGLSRSFYVDGDIQWHDSDELDRFAVKKGMEIMNDRHFRVAPVWSRSFWRREYGGYFSRSPGGSGYQTTNPRTFVTPLDLRDLSFETFPGYERYGDLPCYDGARMRDPLPHEEARWHTHRYSGSRRFSAYPFDSDLYDTKTGWRTIRQYLFVPNPGEAGGGIILRWDPADRKTEIRKARKPGGSKRLEDNLNGVTVWDPGKEMWRSFPYNAPGLVKEEETGGPTSH